MTQYTPLQKVFEASGSIFPFYVLWKFNGYQYKVTNTTSNSCWECFRWEPDLKQYGIARREFKGKGKSWSLVQNPEQATTTTTEPKSLNDLFAEANSQFPFYVSASNQRKGIWKVTKQHKHSFDTMYWRNNWVQKDNWGANNKIWIMAQNPEVKGIYTKINTVDPLQPIGCKCPLDYSGINHTESCSFKNGEAERNILKDFYSKGRYNE